MAQIDYSAVGATYRSEADRTLTRAIAFAVILVLAHLLEIRPSEVDALGLKISLTDPSVLYGLIAMVFGYYLSRAVWHGEKGQSLLPFRDEPLRMRYNLKLAKRVYWMEKKNRGKPVNHREIKRSARRYIFFTDIVLAPYVIIASLFVIAAIPIMAFDLWNLAKLIFELNFPVEP